MQGVPLLSRYLFFYFLASCEIDFSSAKCRDKRLLSKEENRRKKKRLFFTLKWITAKLKKKYNITNLNIAINNKFSRDIFERK